jgi:hypothetical protein
MMMMQNTFPLARKAMGGAPAGGEGESSESERDGGSSESER